MKFLHAADLHIDSPLRGLEAYPGAPIERVRLATRDALTRLVDIALHEAVDLVVIAGDIFDQDWKDFNTALFVAKELQRLDKAGIPVIAIRGNHDSEAGMTRRVPWPTQHFRLLGHKQPETVLLESLGIAVHGMSFPERHVAEDLSQRYPAPVPGLFNIGLLHTSAEGSTATTGHAVYAPCRVSDLAVKGYGYWALGHIHQYEVLHSTGCHVVFAGNTQGRHIRETGAKGCVLVTVQDGEVSDMQFLTTDVLRWEHLVIELAESDTLAALFDVARARVQEALERAEGRLLGVRLEFRGVCAAHRELGQDLQRQAAQTELRALVHELSEEAWVEKILWDTRAPWDREELRNGQDWLGELLRQMDTLETDTNAREQLLAVLQPLLMKVGPELQGRPVEGGPFTGEIDFRDAANVQRWLRAAENVLLSGLV